MKQVLVELPAELAARLERVAPARSRQRSQFIRMAIQKALWELDELTTRRAYLRSTPTDEAWPEADWQAWAAPARRARRRPRG
jgi:predicted transcriptional regulator